MITDNMKTEAQHDVKEIWGSAAHSRRCQIKNATDEIDRGLVDLADMLRLSYFTTGAQNIEVHAVEFINGVVCGRVTFTTRWFCGFKITNTIKLSMIPGLTSEVSLSYRLLGVPYRCYEHYYYADAHMLKTAAQYLAEKYIK